VEVMTDWVTDDESCTEENDGINEINKILKNKFNK